MPRLIKAKRKRKRKGESQQLRERAGLIAADARRLVQEYKEHAQKRRALVQKHKQIIYWPAAPETETDS